MRIHSFLLLPCVFLLFSRADASFGYGLLRCLFTSKEDVVYLAQIYFNKMLLGQYNSTLGKYVGYTEKTKAVTDQLNKDKSFLEEEKKNEKLCRSNVPVVFDVLSRPVEPTVRLRVAEVADSKHPAMLICSAYNFYPKHIKLTWLRDGKEATSDVMSTEELPNGNWLYQIHSYLEITPKPGENISCMVEHASLMQPKFYDWVPTTEAEKNKIAIGAAGLLLGLVFLLVGVIFYKRKTTGRMLVPTS
ncbi:HLA class II histocompatibility antigen, DQ beta 2 chain-like [Archocentrus centrarchus]|uniref:HLA class II histocompatibility antigen, DQ beta 2 chain-like n=1 Tax=Archocentrus centrarchus TaxID=63155 RepID=UPI0011EA072E|nr:HLA class II histocompatibility antigen, DQ beta 2 chain-like [Archocentrus centrarchus]